MRRLWTAGVFVVAALLAACGGGKKDNVLPTVVTTTAVPVTSPALPTIKFGSPEEAIRHLFLQWTAGDREAAAQAATPDSVNALFAKPAGENKFRGCSNPPDGNSSDCTYQYKTGLLEMHLVHANGTWQVTSVQFQGV